MMMMCGAWRAVVANLHVLTTLCVDDALWLQWWDELAEEDLEEVGLSLNPKP